MIFFLFDKQKTAYEMRISDWSSDVCSSDLEEDDHNIAEGLPADEEQDRRQRRGRTAEPVDRRNAEEGEQIIEQPVARMEQIAPDEIGRASCRERVCQYV